MELRRALRNLLENVGAHGVRATARIARDDGDLRVVIEDEGPGIPEPIWSGCSAPSFGSTSPGPGTGGHVIARTIIRGHGGNIRLENGAEGGWRATIALPGGGGP